jgi:FdhE protein
MTASAATVDRLKRDRPEWAPWLAVVDEIARETSARQWDAVVPADVPPSRPATPLLAGLTLTVPRRAVHRLFERVVRIASHGGTTRMRTLEAALDPGIDALALFSSALCQDEVVEKTAVARGADADALQAVATLLPVPFLHAVRRRFAAAVPVSWSEGYCPLCGSWPAFAEVRGIERSRHHRCGRCASEWHARALRCPYCAMHDHDELVTLVPEKGSTPGPGAPAETEAQGVIEACRRCLGYLKTFTRLQGCSPETVMLEDLASVALDVAALEQGYRRPPGAGYPLGITVTDGGARRRFLAWT